MAELESNDVGGNDGGDDGVETGAQVGRKKPKRLLVFNSPSTWIGISDAEILLRMRPNEPRLFPCKGPDSSATARALVAYADRINRSASQTIQAERALRGEKIAEGEKFFTIQTSQSIVIYTAYEDVIEVVDGVEKVRQAPRDAVERNIRCVVTRNVLYEMALEYERQQAEQAALAAVAAEETQSAEPAAKRPRGRPRKGTVRPVVVEGPKRGRGRPKKNAGQESLI